MLDEGDVAHRAARGNFGLIWVQGKGAGLPQYASVDATLGAANGRGSPASCCARPVSTSRSSQPGGVHVCLTAAELEQRVAMLDALQAQPGFRRYRVEVFDRAELATRLPGLGAEVVGGTYCPTRWPLQSAEAPARVAGGDDSRRRRLSCRASGRADRAARGRASCSIPARGSDCRRQGRARGGSRQRGSRADGRTRRTGATQQGPDHRARARSALSRDAARHDPADRRRDGADRRSQQDRGFDESLRDRRARGDGCARRARVSGARPCARRARLGGIARDERPTAFRCTSNRPRIRARSSRPATAA